MWVLSQSPQNHLTPHNSRPFPTALHLTSDTHNDLIQNVMQTTTLRQTLLTQNSNNDDAEWLWKQQICQTVCWPTTTTMMCVPETAQYMVSIPHFGGGSNNNSNAAAPKYHELLPVTLGTFPTAIDETLLAPCRWSRSLHRYQSRGPTELVAVCTTSRLPAIQFTGIVGSGHQCIRSNNPWIPPVPSPPQQQSLPQNSTF